MSRITLPLLFLSMMLSVPSLAQENDYTYSKEFLWGINKNTNGGLIGGFMMRFGSIVSEDHYQSIGIELLNVKHPREFRYNSIAGNPFIWAKTNYLYSVRSYYSREWILFKKAPQQGVQISGNLGAGPTIGLVVPYYIQFQTSPSNVERVPFDPDVHGNFFGNVLGSGSLLQGIGQAKIQPGVNFKTSLSFEFGTFKSNVTGFEVGFAVEAFTKDIPLMAFSDNRSTYFSSFITLFYGSRD